MIKAKHLALATLLSIGTLSLIPTNYSKASSWGLSLAPNTGWRSHWDNAVTKQDNINVTGRGYIGVDRLDGSGSSLTSRVVNYNGQVRTGRVTVDRGDYGDYPAPGILTDEMMAGYEYTPQMYNNTSVNSYIWASGGWSPDN